MTVTERARATASDWHGGSSSPLYSLASTGKVWSEYHRQGCLAEIRECGRLGQDVWELRQLAHLRRCVRRAPAQHPKGDRTATDSA